MSKSKLTLFAGAAVLLWLGTPAAPAQYYPPTRYTRPNLRPRLSPYLNLLRGGDPASNYYLGTVPERQRRVNTAVFGSAIVNLAQRQPPVRREDQDDLFTPLPTTGHPVAFQNYGSYYDFGDGRRISPRRSFQPRRRR